MKKYLATILSGFGLALPALAQTTRGDAPTSGGGSGAMWQRLANVIGQNTYSTNTNASSFTQYLGLIVNVILSLFGIIFVFLIILAGYNWMTAYGQKEKVTKATHTIQAAIIGLLITVAVYALWQFIFFRIISPS